MYCPFRGEPGCPGGLRPVTHAQSFWACGMKKGNKSQMPTDIYKHMARATNLTLCVCVHACVCLFPAVIQKTQVWLKWFSSGYKISQKLTLGIKPSIEKHIQGENISAKADFTSHILQTLLSCRDPNILAVLPGNNLNHLKFKIYQIAEV